MMYLNNKNFYSSDYSNYYLIHPSHFCRGHGCDDGDAAVVGAAVDLLVVSSFVVVGAAAWTTTSTPTWFLPLHYHHPYYSDPYYYTFVVVESVSFCSTRMLICIRCNFHLTLIWNSDPHLRIELVLVT